jgi:hypothetical protein
LIIISCSCVAKPVATSYEIGPEMLVYSTSSLVLVGPGPEPVADEVEEDDPDEAELEDDDEDEPEDELEELADVGLEDEELVLIELLELVVCEEVVLVVVVEDLEAKTTAATPAIITMITTMMTATILPMASRLSGTNMFWILPEIYLIIVSFCEQQDSKSFLVLTF